MVELQGRGPGPFGTMVLSDLGADVLSITRAGEVAAGEDQSAMERMLAGRRRIDLVTRGKRSVGLDLKHPAGLAAALRLVDRADVFVESNRPGVTGRLGLGSDACLARNPRLVYVRMTGWGQEGPYASTPGHDLNYIALSGALQHMRRPGQPPVPPLNLLGDYGGGGMLLVVGVLAALHERSSSGQGQVVDAAMVDGVSLLTTLFYGLRAEGLWSDEPGTNVLDLGAPHYNLYETADGRYVSVAAGEPAFYRNLIEHLGLDPAMASRQADQARWAGDREILAATFRTRTLAEWCARLEGTDTCFAPVLSMAEAPSHPHLQARSTFVDQGGTVQPAPAPRFARTPAGRPGPPVVAGEHTVGALRAWGFGPAEIDSLIAQGAAAQAPEG